MKYRIWLISGLLFLSIHANAQHTRLAKLRTYMGVTYYRISAEELESYFLEFSKLSSDLVGGGSPQILYPSGLGSHIRLMYPSNEKLWIGVHCSYFRTDAALKYHSDQLTRSQATSVVKYGSFEFIGRYLITDKYKLKPHIQAGLGSMISKASFNWQVEWNDQLDYPSSYRSEDQLGLGNSMSIEIGAESKFSERVGLSSSMGYRGGSGNTNSYGKPNKISLDHDGLYLTFSIFAEL